MATSSPHASISGRNRAIRDTWRANLAAKALFRVEEPEIMHGAKMLPAPPGLSAAAACSPAERALRPAARAWPACRMRPPAVLLVSAAACASPPSRPRSSPPSYTCRASPPASRPPCAAIRRTAHCGRGEPSIRLFLLPSCCPRRANRVPAPSQPGLVHPWSRLRPSAPRHPPRLTLPRGSRCGSDNSREMVR